jgi:hypothetical protein
MATANSINANNSGIQGYDGAGTWNASSLTQYQVQIGGANNHTLAGVSVGTNGQVLLGSTGAAPVFATLGAGTGISYATGAGTLTISAVGGGLTWTVVSGATQTMAVNNGYFANRGSNMVFSLPTTSAVGDMVAVNNMNTALGWTISYTTNQQIFFGSSSSTLTSGSLSSTAVGDTVILVCRTANLTWAVVSSIGNITIA